jgi:phage shock protein A
MDSIDGVVSFRKDLGGNQSGLMSLHSLSVDPGNVLKLPNAKRGTNSAIIEHTPEAQSYLRIETYAPNMSQQEMESIRSSVDSLTRNIGTQLATRIQEAKARQLAAESQNQAASAKDEADKAEAEAKSIDKQLDEIRTKENERVKKLGGLNERLNTFKGLRSVGPESTTLTPQEREALADLAEATKKLETEEAQAAESREQLESRKQALLQKATDQKAIATREQGIANVATDQAQSATEARTTSDGEIRKNQEALLKALSKPNAVVFRWNAEDDSSSSAAVSGFFGSGSASGKASKAKNEKAGGYAVMNGFRRVRLIIGEDFRTSQPTDAVSSLGELSNSLGLRYGGGVIVTSVIQTRELMYFTSEDLEAAISAQVSVQIDAAPIPDAQKSELKASLQFELRRLQSIENSGYLTAPNIQKVPLDWKIWNTTPATPGEPVAEVVSPPLREKGWITVHAITSTLPEILAQRVKSDPTAARTTPRR